MTADPMDLPEASPEEEIMRRVRGGEIEMYAFLVRRHQDALVQFFRRMGAEGEAEDLAQKTFLRIYDARERYRARATFRSFLFHVARRVWVDWVRHRARREAALSRFSDHLAALALEAEGGSKQVPDINAALRQLSDAHRTVLVLSLFQGLTQPEIADTLGIPLGTVKSRMFRALEQLREHMYARQSL